MPTKVDNIKLTLEQNKRVKLTPEDKKTIQCRYRDGELSMRELAREYGVSKRSIQFAVYPERYQKALKRRRVAWAAGKYREYYDKDKHREAMRSIRSRKKEQLKKYERDKHHTV